MIADILKGVLPVLLARLTPYAEVGAITGALAAIAGHNWSIYIGFKGGRGVSTSLGGLLAMSPVPAVLCAIAAIAVMAVSRYVSVGSILGALIAVIVIGVLVILGLVSLYVLIYIAVATSLLIFQHRDNIERLLSGKERKIGQKAESL